MLFKRARDNDVWYEPHLLIFRKQKKETRILPRACVRVRGSADWAEGLSGEGGGSLVSSPFPFQYVLVLPCVTFVI